MTRGMCWVLAVIVSAASIAGAAEKKLNVLLIYVDDLNTRLGCYGDPVVKTPNIDKLAAMGVRFNRAYCQYPVCNGSRTSTLSGRYPLTTQVMSNNTPPRTTVGDIPFLPEYFHAGGYFTAKAGKIPHGTFDSAVKWDVSDHSTAEEDGTPKKKKKGADADAGGAAADVAAACAAKEKTDAQRALAKQKRAQKDQPNTVPDSVAWAAPDVKDEDLGDGQTTLKVIGYLEGHHTEPFFIAAGYHKPHRPYIAPKSYFKDYPADKQPMSLQPPHDPRENVPPMAFTNIKEDEALTDEQQRDAIAAYHACIAYIDAQVGKLMATMDRLQLWDSTAVVFLSDHGYHLGDHGKVWRKNTLFEEAARVPFIVYMPGNKPGTCVRTVELLSIYPTLVELCGLPANPGLEGVSIVSLLKDPGAAWDRPAFTVVGRGKEGTGWSLRTERWRYAEWGPKRDAELYDLRADPKEFFNLAHNPQYADVVKDLSGKLRGKWPTHTTAEKSKGGGGG